MSTEVAKIEPRVPANPVYLNIYHLHDRVITYKAN